MARFDVLLKQNLNGIPCEISLLGNTTEVIQEDCAVTTNVAKALLEKLAPLLNPHKYSENVQNAIAILRFAEAEVIRFHETDNVKRLIHDALELLQK